MNFSPSELVVLVVAFIGAMVSIIGWRKTYSYQ